MAFTGQALADGQLPSTKGTLYTVPGATTAYIKFMSVFNTNAAQQTVIIYANVSGTSREIARFVLEQNEWARVIEKDEALVLEAADLIEAETTTATAVNYLITGVEEA
jgi:hypothetical protein